MLKKLLLVALLALPIGAIAQNLKFGHLNSGEIIMAMPETTKAQADLKALQEKYVAEINRTNDEFQKKMTEYQQAMQKDSLPQNIAERRQKELEDMAQRAQQFQQEAQQNMQKKEQELMAPIYQKVEGAIKAIGEEQGFTYIFDLSRTSIPFINEKTSVNVTASIKTKLGVK